MNLHISDVSALLRLAAGANVDAKQLLRLVSVELLKELGSNRYLVQVEGKELEARSERPLKAGSRFWAEVSRPSPKAPLTLQHLLQKPVLPEMLSTLAPRFEARYVEQLLRQSDAASSLKGELVSQLSQAATKEEFTALSQLVLSLQHGVMTLPLFYERYLGFFQMKKRYNKQTKKLSVSFYAALEQLGPVEGTLLMRDGSVDGTVRTAFDATAQFLQKQLETLPPGIRLTVVKTGEIAPLFEPTNTLLDISI